ncbi:MAG: hypothetical protein AB1568_01575 [Thermodesulfobacteriota bacterium]
MSSDTQTEQQMNVDAILDDYRADPYSYVDILTIHTGVIRFKVKEGDPIEGPGGKWNHIPGTQLYELERERNCKRLFASDSGVISFIRADLEGQFVEAGEKVMTIRHPLKKKEIIDRILRNVLYPVTAPERAKYFFALEIQSRIEKFGQRSVSIKPGEELFTMSLMKRDTPVYYEGEPGIIHTVYFQPGISVNQGDPLIGICPPDKLPLIQRIINRVKAEWE